MNRFLTLVAVATLGLVIGLLIPPSAFHRSGPQLVHAQWVSSANTIAEEAAEADAIVRVRVQKVLPTRSLTLTLAPEAQKPDFKDMVSPFTDSMVQVLEVYKGSVNRVISIMQTGGFLPATDRHPLINFHLEDDSIFVAGNEHILFLKDISGDQVQAKGRQLYRIVNSRGRYNIQGEIVSSLADFVDGYTPPSTTAQLVDEIRQALARR
jgi:hypothetical protein